MHFNRFILINYESSAILRIYQSRANILFLPSGSRKTTKPDLDAETTLCQLVMEYA